MRARMIFCIKPPIPVNSSKYWTQMLHGTNSKHNNKGLRNIYTENYSTKKWFDVSIRHKLNCVHTIRRQSRKNPSNAILRKLETAENELQSLIQSAKDNYLENLTTSFQHDPKKLYGHLKQLNQNKIKPNHIVENGNVLAHPREKAESFNKYFNSTFTSSSLRICWI